MAESELTRLRNLVSSIRSLPGIMGPDGEFDCYLDTETVRRLIDDHENRDEETYVAVAKSGWFASPSGQPTESAAAEHAKTMADCYKEAFRATTRAEAKVLEAARNERLDREREERRLLTEQSDRERAAQDAETARVAAERHAELEAHRW